MTRRRWAILGGSPLLSLFLATHVFSWQFGTHPSLGPHWDGFYPPWAILQWAWWWGRAAPALFTWAAIAGGAVWGGCLLLLLRPETPKERL